MILVARFRNIFITVGILQYGNWQQAAIVTCPYIPTKKISKLQNYQNYHNHDHKQVNRKSTRYLSAITCSYYQ